MHWYTEVVKKYAVFDGRATRPEFWWFTLINAIIQTLVLIVFAAVAGLKAGQTAQSLYGLALLLPSLGVSIRRLHDTNHSGWWVLIGLIPIIGWVWIIVLLATASDPGTNRYGPPVGAGATAGPGVTANFDAETGRPIVGYDPQTGEPILGERSP